LDGRERSNGITLCLWHPVPCRVWGSPDLRMPHRMNTGINTRKTACCWTATITGVSENASDTLNQPFLIIVDEMLLPVMMSSKEAAD